MHEQEGVRVSYAMSLCGESDMLTLSSLTESMDNPLPKLSDQRQVCLNLIVYTSNAKTHQISVTLLGHVGLDRWPYLNKRRSCKSLKAKVPGDNIFTCDCNRVMGGAEAVCKPNNI